MSWRKFIKAINEDPWNDRICSTGFMLCSAYIFWWYATR